MSAQHTQYTRGRMTFKEDGDANHWSMLTEDGRWWLALLSNGEQPSERQIANFRRLAACWNACTGFSTEELDGADLFKDSIESGNLINELLAALKQCRLALEPYDDVKPRDWKTDREKLAFAHQAACAAIAKATAQQ